MQHQKCSLGLYVDFLIASQKQYSGKHHGLENGINLVSMLWTDGEKMIPVDYRVYDPARDGKTKNHHAQEMLNYAETRGFHPDYALMDSWYSSIDNLKNINKKNWKRNVSRKIFLGMSKNGQYPEWQLSIIWQTRKS